MMSYARRSRGQIVAAVFALALFHPTAFAQSKVDPPVTIHGGHAAMTPDQVRNCLFIAKEISDLTDRAKVADERSDIVAFNATVDPYNRAAARWNAQCRSTYEPADMIRAENEAGFRLCEHTSSPCLSDAEREAILDEERRNQAALAPQTGMQRTTNTVRASANTPEPDPDPQWAVVSRSPRSCDGLTGEAEIIACAANALAVETEQINSRYNALRATLDPESFARLRSVQLLWIRYKDAACELESDVSTGTFPRQALRDHCLARQTRVRLDELQPFED